MNTSRVPALLPIFRSPQQLKVFAHLLINAGKKFTVPELVRVTGVSQPTVWREIDRLEKAALATVDSVGRSKVINANEDSPYFPELRSLAMKLLGPAVILSERLEDLEGLKEAYIFGSWARRYHGEPGPPPADIDVLIVGDADPDEAEDRCRGLQEILDVEVNSVVVSRSEWKAARSGFVREVQKGPLVPIVEKAA
ncbi:MAG: nucleotidyltransferase domain-containing protein [Actinomycetota bacterium]